MTPQFSELGINESLQKSLTDLQMSVPTDIQVKTIPVILNQKDDVVVMAKTGTGKTAGLWFTLAAIS